MNRQDLLIGLGAFTLLVIGIAGVLLVSLDGSEGNLAVSPSAVALLLPTVTPAPAESSDRAPIATQLQTTLDGSAVSAGQTGPSGDIMFIDPLAQRRLVVRTLEDRTTTALSGITVAVVSNGTRILVYAEDPQGAHVPVLLERSYAPKGTGHSSVPHLASRRPASLRQGIIEVLVIMKAISLAQATSDLLNLLVIDRPDLLAWNWRYEEECVTGEQLARAIRLNIALLPVPGDQYLAAILAGEKLIGSTVITEAIEDRYQEPVRVRIYHLPWEQLGAMMRNRSLYEVLGPCEPPAENSRELQGEIAFIRRRTQPPYDDALWTLIVETGEERMLVSRKTIADVTGSSMGSLQSPEWSPDGRQIAFIGPGSLPPDYMALSALWLINSDGSGLRQFNTDSYLPPLRWSPQGRFITGLHCWPRNCNEPLLLDLDQGTQDVLEIGGLSPDDQIADMAWSPPGDSLALALESRSQIQLAMRGGEVERTFSIAIVSLETLLPTSRLGPFSGVPHFDLDWNSVRSELALTGWDRDGVNIYVVDLSSAHLQPLTGDGLSWGPRYSPDGRWIAFTKNESRWPGHEDGDTEIWVMRTDGTSQRFITEGWGAAWRSRP